MSYTSILRKAKLTVTISGDVVNEIDKIAKRCGVERKIIDAKYSHYIFIYVDIQFFKALKRGEIKL